MEREMTTTHFITNRLGTWCPVCGASEGKGCAPVKGLRFESHNLLAVGGYQKPTYVPSWEQAQTRQKVL